MKEVDVMINDLMIVNEDKKFEIEDFRKMNFLINSERDGLINEV